MPDPIDISTIEDWNELDDYEQAQLVASIRKSGRNIVGLEPAMIKRLSRLGGYPDLPAPQVEMKEDYRLPQAIQSGSAFMGGAVPGAKMGAAISGGNPLGAVAGGLAGGGVSALLDYFISQKMGVKPEAGTARNAINAASGAIPGGAGIRAGMVRSGMEGAAGQALDNFINRQTTEGIPPARGGKFWIPGKAPMQKGPGESATIGVDQTNPITMGIAGTTTSGLLNGLTKPFGERMRKVASEKDLTEFLQKKMGPGTSIPIGKLIKEALGTNIDEPLLPESKPFFAEKMREIRERTGFDPLSFTKEDRELLGKIAGKPNKEIFQEILSPIFSAKRTEELPAAAEAVKKGINSMSLASGKPREAFMKGLRKTFVQNVLGDDDIMNRPDSFRFRLEAMGPDVVNEIFSSAGKKGERSGAYHALMNLAEAATKEGGHFKVLLNPDGVTILQRAAGMAQRTPIVGDILQKMGVPGKPNYKLNTENKLDMPQRVAEMLGIGATMYAHPLAGIAATGAVGAREGMRAAHFSWEKAIEKFAARSNRASDILRILASGEQRFSRPMINNFMKSLVEDADQKIGWDD